MQVISELLENDIFIECRAHSVEEIATSYIHHSNNTQKVYASSSKILDFVYFMNEDTKSSNADKSESFLQKLQFYWKISIEMRAIYNLMLNEQKESIHGRVVRFYYFY